MINYGDIMAVDILLIEGNGIKMGESALKGESDSMKKEKFDKCYELYKSGDKKLPSPLILSGINCVERNDNVEKIEFNVFGKSSRSLS